MIENETLKPTLELVNPLLVAHGFSDTEAVFQYGAADIVLQLTWEGNAAYRIIIIDVGFHDRRIVDPTNEPTGQQHFSGLISIEIASAMMFLLTAADELNGLNPVTDNIIARFYDLVEAWLATNDIPTNLRMIP